MSIEREIILVERFIHYYCKNKHKNRVGKLCSECRHLLAYSLERLDSCPFADEKSSCRQCEVHCYNSFYRERIREVMRYCGPRSLWFMPLEYVKHWRREREK